MKKKRHQPQVGNGKTKGDHMTSSSSEAVASSTRIQIRVVAPKRTTNAKPSSDPIVCSFPGGIPASVLPASMTRDDDDPIHAVNNTNEEALSELPSRGGQTPTFLWCKVDDKNDKGDPPVHKDWTPTTVSTKIVGKDNCCMFSSQVVPCRGKLDDSSTTRTVTLDQTQLCVGIYDKQKKRLTLQRTTGYGSVFCLQQSVLSYQRLQGSASGGGGSGGGGERSTQTAREEQQQQQHRSLLAEEFGSAKKRKVLRSQNANRVDVQSAVGTGDAMMESLRSGGVAAKAHNGDEKANPQSAANHSGLNDAATSTTTATNPAMEAATQQWRRSFLPKYREDAKHPSEVYDARDMISEQTWKTTSRMVDNCWSHDDVVNTLISQTNGSNTTNTSSPQRTPHHDIWTNQAIRDLLDRVVVRKGIDSKYQLICTILLNYHVNLYTQLHRKRFIHAASRDTDGYGIPAEVRYHFLTTFATSISNRKDQGETGYVMSKPDKDRCLVHILLLYVMADSGTLMRSDNIRPLADALQIDVRDASHLLRQAGCTVQRKAGTSEVSAVLKTPLTFPIVKRKITRGR